MNFLRATLIGIYAALIILLCLTRCERDDIGNQHSEWEGWHEDEPAGTTDDEEAEEIAEQTGGSGDLKITLLWDFVADIDLHVLEPNGNEIYFANAQDPATGGYLDIDNTQGGRGSAENVYWRNPPRGTYKVTLNYYNGDRSGECKVVVMKRGEAAQTYTIRMTPSSGTQFVTFVNY